MTELKPCPFCGSPYGCALYKEQYLKIDSIADTFKVICHICKCGTGSCPSKEIAITAWNRRVGDKND